MDADAAVEQVVGDGQGQAGPSTANHTPGDQLAENCVAYWLFIVASGSQLDARQTRQQLETVRKAAVQLSQSLTKDYVWQRDDFSIELRTAADLVYLHGVTDFGDAVEDEWLIVYMLRELTKSFPNLWVRIADADGEFLLIEAANVLPGWLSPDNDHCRVWIHDGRLRIIPQKENSRGGSQGSKHLLSLPEAVQSLKANAQALIDSGPIQAEAFYRLKKYPGHITTSMHHALVMIPRKLAYILHSLPKAIAPAIECFYLRDPFTLKPVLSAAGPPVFPPSDLVTVSVRFSKVLFAQLRSQRFEVPPAWKPAFDSTPAKQRDMLDMGMKLTSGFEMLAAEAEQNKCRVVREMAILLQDLEEDGEESLPTNQDIETWDNVHRNDEESWLDINYEDFEKELDGIGKKSHSQGQTQVGSGFGDTQTQENLRKIVSRFEEFLKDDQAGLDGAELESHESGDDSRDEEEDDDGSDSELGDADIRFDEDAFTGLLRQMMGQGQSNVAPRTPQRSSPGKEKGKQRAREDPALESHDEDQAIQELSSQMEAELKGFGALKLDAQPAKKQAALKNTGNQAAAAQQNAGKGRQEQDQEEDSNEEIDIDYNLAKNLLESFKSQGGMAGPAGNLMGLMGFQLPRDEDDGKDG
ncbi:Protein SGT1 [Escovopsis weberi]|uniref:Protein SGT1 n=1 Tax=Escovopsis weberi TaxID=150374 RepID=A0A0M8MVF9_ESCWE|nr:Protein SGT1 [Escovopsis weberi]